MATRSGPWRPHGLILAGGRASRLGGGDKGLLPVGGRTVLASLVMRLAPQCDGLLLSANGDPSRFSGLALPVVADAAADADAGPLAGLLAGLDRIADDRGEVGDVVVVPGDTPFLPRDLAARLAATRAAAGAVAACACSAGRSHPLIGLWPIGIRHDLRAAVRNAGLRRVGAFVERHAVAWADWPADPVDPFLNINTPADLAAAQRLGDLP